MMEMATMPHLRNHDSVILALMAYIPVMACNFYFIARTDMLTASYLHQENLQASIDLTYFTSAYIYFRPDIQEETKILWPQKVELQLSSHKTSASN